ncbi:beta-xylosidase [Sphingomonas piscis]|uniref:Beta-xylosidase n=1 Tax=Sphingomonas piscis TaxID=2714943 RepID=A0A6G7YRM5_9SPHN|nr:beta-xylosidase [Sphingomonas piscis]QIK79398.1 beta-xylosidase [Sphingomonas piscis]
MRQFIRPAIVAALAIGTAAQAHPKAFPVTITVDASKTIGELKPVWRFFGADEPNFATMKDGRKLLGELGALKPGGVYFRAHNLLTSGDGTPSFKWGSTGIYREDADGKPVYDFTVVDRIIDTYLERGIHPYLQLGFMPEAMSSAPKGTPYQHNWRPGFGSDSLQGGWNYPPKDYAKWGELIFQWTRHNVERYGAGEVQKWYFETWNEPNLDIYWKGTSEEFFRMHDEAIRAVRRALPSARVGGPDVAGSGGAFMDAFLAHARSGDAAPTNFLSFHAKGSPTFENGHVRMGIAAQLKTVDEGFAKIAAAGPLANKPIVIGESDPEGCAACSSPQNGYRNGTMYSSYTAASFARIWELARRHKVNLEGVLTWAFTFENQPYFAGYRQLASNGIDLPVLNTFRMFARLGEQQVAASSSGQLALDNIMADGVRGTPDVGVLATRTSRGVVALMIWNYHDDDIAGPDAAVSLQLRGFASRRPTKATLWRVDKRHGNSFAAWQALGSPAAMDEKQYATVEKAAAMTPETMPVAFARGQAQLNVSVPRQGVLLVELQ